MTLARLGAFLVPDRGVLLPRPYAVVAATGLLLGTLAAVSTPGQRAEWSLYDLFSRRLAADASPAPEVVVVAIDEPSFAEIGLPWPWPRSLHGTLIDQIAQGGAMSIALDVLFDVPAVNAGDDTALADAIARAGNVVLAADQAVVEDRGYTLTQWTEPIATLAKPAAGIGVIRIPYDADNVLRRAWLTVEGRPTLGLAVASRTPGFAGPGPDAAALVETHLVRFNGAPRQGIVTVSYYQALDARGSLPADIFRNKHVLVGRSLAATTIDEQADHFTTPVAARMAGVEVHATIVDALLRRRFIADPFRHSVRLVALCLGVGILAAVSLFALGPMTAPLAASAGVATLVAAGYVLLASGTRLPVVAPTLAIAGVYVLTAAYRFGLVSRERRMIKRAFQHYVAPAIVEQMLDDPSRLRLGGTEYDVTVLFSDLEGFTTLAEHLGATELSAHLGGYFKEMLDVLLVERGTLDKLIGDSIMMYFGCPIPDASHARQACRGALAMQRRMVALNARWAERGLPQLRTRIGINTGRAVAGNMGTDTIFNYTILGDAVNLASRLEGVNKEYGTLIIIGEDTFAEVGDAFDTRELDWIRVKGKTRPAAIHELIGERGSMAGERRDLVARYAEGLAHYRSGRWQEASDAFAHALALDPRDGPSLTMLKRVESCLGQAPADWDGVHVMRTK